MVTLSVAAVSHESERLRHRPTAEKATKQDHVVGTLDACTGVLHSVNEGIVMFEGK